MPTFEFLSFSQTMYVDGGHLHPGEVGWGGSEAECRVEDQVLILCCGHGVIFLLVWCWVVTGMCWFLVDDYAWYLENSWSDKIWITKHTAKCYEDFAWEACTPTIR